MSIDPQEFAVIKTELKALTEAATKTLPSKIESIESSLESDRLDVKLLAREVQELTGAVRENNKLLKGSNGNSVLVRLALIEANQKELESKLKDAKADNESDSKARLQLVGTSIAAVLALAGTIIMGIFNLMGG